MPLGKETTAPPPSVPPSLASCRQSQPGPPSAWVLRVKELFTRIPPETSKPKCTVSLGAAVTRLSAGGLGLVRLIGPAIETRAPAYCGLALTLPPIASPKPLG